jgi:hypothetical protein
MRTGENAAEHALGVDVWEHRRRHPADQEVFDARRARCPAATPSVSLLRTTSAGIGWSRTSEAEPARCSRRCWRPTRPSRGILFDQSQVVAGAALCSAPPASPTRVIVGALGGRTGMIATR